MCVCVSMPALPEYRRPYGDVILVAAEVPQQPNNHTYHSDLRSRVDIHNSLMAHASEKSSEQDHFGLALTNKFLFNVL